MPGKNKQKIAKPFGEVILLPISKYRDGKNLQKALNMLVGITEYVKASPRVSSWEKNRYIKINEFDLKEVSKVYSEENNGRQLVHIYPANSPMAFKKPSDLGIEPRQKGLAEVYQGWVKDKYDRVVHPIDWLIVAGIPTLTAEGGTPEKAEIEFYIKQLYFYLGQGKSICLPIRENPISKTSGSKTKSSPQGSKNNKFYEYAFGKGIAESFEHHEYLQKELANLENAMRELNKLKGNPTKKEISEKIPGNYLEAFELGKKKRDLEEYPRVYFPKLTPKTKPVENTITSQDQAWQKINSDAFMENFSGGGRGYTVEISEDKNQATISSKKKNIEVVLSKNSDGRVSASTTSFTEDALSLMAEAMFKALGLNSKVTINVSSQSQAGGDTILQQLYLSAMSMGLIVVGYTPDKDTYQKGIIARNKALAKHQEQNSKEDESVSQAGTNNGVGEVPLTDKRFTQ